MTGPDELRQNIQFLKGLASARVPMLQRLGIETVGDLLWHFPRGYDEFSGLKQINQLVEGQIQTVRGEVIDIASRRTATRKAMVTLLIDDGSGEQVEAIWFNQHWRANRHHMGQFLAVTGKPSWSRGKWRMNMPEARDAHDVGDSTDLVIISKYPATSDLPTESLRVIIRKALDQYADNLIEKLPNAVLERRGLPPINKAIRDIHFPETMQDAKNARRRFVYEEFLVLQLALAVRRRELRSRQRASKLPLTKTIDTRIRRLFAFELTNDQNKVLSEIVKDLNDERPMQRLLHADVGAGKTAVAIYALLVAVANKHQAALMAPTEVLARQHYRTLRDLLTHSQVRLKLLTGSLSPKEKRIALAEIASGNADLVVGTQALVQDSVQFAKLGLVVIDEQHKFGVNQRARFRKLGLDPHYLVMTATPIPRTVALTVFGDLDTSQITELPPGRQPVKTKWVTDKDREHIYEQLLEELQKGKQMYVICPLVQESETLDLKAAQETFLELQAGPFAGVQLGLLHGRMDEKVKDNIMQQFREKEIDVLVSTVVVEVGVDIPNATLMIIEHADRFGLSQLHQLRGRVSRGPVAGQCYLFANPSSADGKERLRIMTRTSNGFKLAEEDARLRGLGEFFGTRQHGLGELRVGNLITDSDILNISRKDAFEMVLHDPRLKEPEHLALRMAVLDKYGQTLDLAEVG